MFKPSRKPFHLNGRGELPFTPCLRTVYGDQCQHRRHGAGPYDASNRLVPAQVIHRSRRRVFDPCLRIAVAQRAVSLMHGGLPCCHPVQTLPGTR
jgi:hypothetical protein